MRIDARNTVDLKNENIQGKHSVIGIFLLLIILGLSQYSANASAQELATFRGIEVTKVGEGKDLIFIPGLMSGAEAFEEVCEHFNASYRCHLLQLPGFAGAEPIAELEDGFMYPMRDRVIAYIQEQNLPTPIIVGHSLGGVLSLMIAEQNPDLISAMVIIDSIPFIPATQNPAATAEAMEPIAKRRSQMIMSQTSEQYERQIPMQLMGMTRDESRMPLLTDWAKSGDRKTMAQAMYELYSIDLRDEMNHIVAPAIIFGSWAGYEAYGSTKESTEMIFKSQFKKLSNKKIVMSDSGLHFLMWDDLDWLLDHMDTFLSELNSDKQ